MNNIAYQIERRAVKHFRLRVSEQGTVRLIAPLDATEDEVDNIFTVKKPWIEFQLKRLTGNQQAIHLHRNQILLFGERYHYFHCDESPHNVSVNHQHKTIKANHDLTDTAIQEAWLKKLAGDHIRTRAQELSVLYQLPYQRIFIRNQKTKWGNCTANGNLSFNWRLIKAPRFVIDYVILHELNHTKVMDHSKGFWLKLKIICPRYRDAVDWLEKYGRCL